MKLDKSSYYRLVFENPFIGLQNAFEQRMHFSFANVPLVRIVLFILLFLMLRLPSACRANYFVC